MNSPILNNSNLISLLVYFGFPKIYLGYVLSENINSGLIPTTYSWKNLVRDKLKDAGVINIGLDNTDNALERLCYFSKTSIHVSCL